MDGLILFEEAFGRNLANFAERIEARSIDPYQTLREFGLFMKRRGIQGSTQRVYMSHIRKYIAVNTSQYITKDIFRAKVECILSPVTRVRDASLDKETVRLILEKMPSRLRMLSLLMISTLRRPNELNQLKLEDFDLNKTPVEVHIPAEISKNRVEGLTYLTTECKKHLLNYIEDHQTLPEERVIGYKKTDNASSLFGMYLPHELKVKIRHNRYSIHLYSLKKYAYSIVELKASTAFAHDLKGDISEYRRIPPDMRKELYMSVEPHLIIGI